MLSKNQRVILILVVISLLSTGTSATVQQVGIMANGPVFNIAESGGYAYVGQGAEIHVYDVTTRDKILHLNWSSRITKFHEPTELGYRIRGIEIIGNTLFGADDNELFITDIINPAAPALLSSIKAQISAMAVSADANYVYLSGSSGLQVIDTRDRTRPVQIMTVPDGTAAWRMSISGTRLYLARGNAFYISGNPQMMVYDISNPASPALISTFSPVVAGGYTGMAVKDQYVFATDYYHWVHVIDLSDLANPTIVANITGTNGAVINANDIKVAGNLTFISTRYEGFRVYDITDPRNPVYLGTGKSEVGGYTEGIFVNERYVYLSMESMGTEIYDISNPSLPKRLIHISTLGGVDSLAVAEDELYIGAHNDGIWIVDATDKANMQEISFGFDNGRNDMVALVGDTLYVAGNWAGLFIFDVSDKYHPVQIKKVLSPCYAARVTPDWKYLYTTRQILDITNLYNPVIVNTTPGFVAWAFKGEYVFGAYDKAGGGVGMDVFNITSKAMPIREYTFIPGIVYSDIGLSGDTAIITGSNYIFSYDITDVAAPRLLKQVSYPGFLASHVTIVGDYAYIAGGGNNPKTMIFDIRDPVNLPLVDTFDRPVEYSDGRYLYQLSKFGIAAYTLYGEIPDPVPTSPPPTPVSTPTLAPLPTPTPIPIGPPQILSLNPSSVTNGTASWITVNGNNFFAGSVVRWEKTNRSTKFISSSKLSTWFAIGTAVPTGVVNITVLNPDGNESMQYPFFIIPKTPASIPTPTPAPTPKLPDPIYICLKLVGVNVSIIECTTMEKGEG